MWQLPCRCTPAGSQETKGAYPLGLGRPPGQTQADVNMAVSKKCSGHFLHISRKFPGLFWNKAGIDPVFFRTCFGTFLDLFEELSVNFRELFVKLTDFPKKQFWIYTLFLPIGYIGLDLDRFDAPDRN